MKFNDGFWLNKQGYNIFNANYVYEVKKFNDSLKVFATAKVIENRGMTLEGPVFEITFSSKKQDIIKISTTHYCGKGKVSPAFTLYEDKDFVPVINENEGYYELISGDVKAVISKEKQKFYAKFYHKDTFLTQIDDKSLSYILEDAYITENLKQLNKGERFFSKMDLRGNSYIKGALSLSIGETIYGFGEKFTTFVKNGQSIDIWNSDGGTSSEQSYKNVPFYISSNNYGVFVNHPERVGFEIASEVLSKNSFSVRGETLEFLIIGGENLAEVIKSYTALTGKPALPPSKTFGLWLSTSFQTDYDEKICYDFIDKFKTLGIPLDVFHFDCFWMKDYNWTDFKWNKEVFPNPENTLKTLHEKGLNTCVWINPYISQQSCCFAECAEKEYFIKTLDGSIFQCDLWQPGIALIDFTNKDAFNWYKEKIKEVLRTGVDYIKTDFGERIPTDVVYADGSDPFKMHNYYTYLYNKAVYEALNEHYETAPCLFARSATVGCQQFPVHWGGDCFSSFDSMAETIRGGLSLSLSGFGFFSHDISGFEATAEPDLYKRWCAFGLLSTHSRLHGNVSYRAPWYFGDEAVDVLRHFTNLKGKLMPYIFKNAVKTHETGVPMMRAMVIDYNFDLNTRYLDKQYMLGDSLLVAPILNSEGVGRFYLPLSKDSDGAGKWTDILSGKAYEGGKWYQENYDFFSLPVLAKPNSIICYGDFKDSASYDYLSNSTFVIYGLEDGKTAETEMFDKDGKFLIKISALRTGDVIKVTHTKTDKKFNVKSSDNLKVEMI